MSRSVAVIVITLLPLAAACVGVMMMVELAAFAGAGKEQHRDLVEQLTQLQAYMAENMRRLKRAMDVTRARIDSIMSAVREQTRSEAGYGASGARVQTANAARDMWNCMV